MIFYSILYSCNHFYTFIFMYFLTENRVNLMNTSRDESSCWSSKKFEEILFNSNGTRRIEETCTLFTAITKINGCCTSSVRIIITLFFTVFQKKFDFKISLLVNFLLDFYTLNQVFH